MQLYLDACAIIYAIEGTTPFRDAVLARIEQAESSPAGMLITSRLSRLECRVKPLREGNAALLVTYEDFFARMGVGIVDISAAVIERATTLRVEHGWKTPDAIHLATALEHGADLFLTGDAALAGCSGITTEVIRG